MIRAYALAQFKMTSLLAEYNVPKKSIWYFFKEDTESGRTWEATFMQFTGSVYGSKVDKAGFVIDKSNYLETNPYEPCNRHNESFTSANRIRVSIPYRFDDGGSVVGKTRQGPLFLGELWTFRQLLKACTKIQHLVDTTPWTSSCRASGWEYHARYGEGILISDHDECALETFKRLHDDEKNQAGHHRKGCLSVPTITMNFTEEKCPPPQYDTVCDRCAHVKWPGRGTLVREVDMEGTDAKMKYTGRPLLAFTGRIHLHDKI